MTPIEPPADPPTTPPRSIGGMFWAFNRLSLQGFGGVIGVAQRELVERLRWLTKEDFVELLSLSQVLPGPNVINLALMLGDRWFGTRGALTALAGLLMLPLLIVLGLTAVYAQWAEHPVVSGALRGMAAVAAGLVAATALKLLVTLRHNPMGRGWCAAFTMATVLAVAGLRWPLAAVVLGLGSLALAVAAWRLRGR